MNEKIMTNSIEITNVTVEYRLPHEQYGTFREYFIRFLERRVKYEKFRALDNVDLAVEQGKIHGVIGYNGAGKSTMLKVISRVLKPTKGRVIVRGTVAPLLELGAGFHPELTGRENIYLNGAILGHSNEKMESLLPSIIEFSELNEFIDAPIRTYSSGMYARLGFSVAAASQPDILILDEVLSVGDENFQKKCQGRMREFRDNGVTIFLVSHSMNTILDMCETVTWLHKGKVMKEGAAAEVVEAFQSFGG